MARPHARPAEGGFTLVEVLVALALISTMMAALGTYFISSTKTSRYQSQIQAATRIAQTGMEAARGYGGPTLLVGRGPCGSCVAVTGYGNAANYFANTIRYDAAVNGVTPTLPLPNTAETVVAGGITYYRYYFVGRCWQDITGGLCGATSTLPVAMVRMTIGVLWTAAECPNSMCVRGATSLFSANPADPVFTQ
jgi:prepilin-type N-terminal cleavage/methylation domain-containing protein